MTEKPKLPASGHCHLLLALSFAITDCGAKSQSADTSSSSSTVLTGGATGATGSVTAKPGDSGGATSVGVSGGSHYGGSFAGAATGARASGGTTFNNSTVTPQGGISGTGQGGVATGGYWTTSQDASTPSCDETPLWKAVALQATGGLGYCWIVSPSSIADSGRTAPAIVIDSQGHVVDNTGISGSSKQTWLNGLATQTWPCLAGQTILYGCFIGG